VPLPSNWLIEFCEPVTVCGRLGPGPADDPDEAAVAELADQVRDIIQAKLDALVVERGPAFG